MTRSNPMLWLAGGSLAVLAILIALLYLESQPTSEARSTRSIKVYCAAALRPVMERIADDYSIETNERVEFEFGDSGKMLGQVSLRPDGDLFLPADDSYIRLAQAKDLIAEVTPLCRMRAVILTRAGNPFRLATFDDLLKPELKVSLANPDRAAIGNVVRAHLKSQGKWESLAAKVDVQHMNVTDAANAVHLGSRDATIVWDVVAANYPDLVAIRVPELDGAVGQVAIARLSASPNVELARRFANYVAASDRGQKRMRERGFTGLEAGQSWPERKAP